MGVNENAMSIWLAIIICAIVISSMPGRKTRRWTWGSGWKPVLAAHQSGGRSQIFCCTSSETSLYGPVPMGQPFDRSAFVKLGRIPPVPDAPRDDRHGDVGAEGEVVPVEARRWTLQVADERQIVGGTD